jgi:hypothetical protein
MIFQAQTASADTTAWCPVVAHSRQRAGKAGSGAVVDHPEGESPGEIDECLTLAILLVCSRCQRLRCSPLVRVGHGW